MTREIQDCYEGETHEDGGALDDFLEETVENSLRDRRKEAEIV